jgi:hypothetical protein
MPPLTRRLFCAAPAAAFAAGETAISGGWDATRLAATLIPRERWRPFPRLEERAAWEGIPADTRDAILAAGRAALGKPWGDLPATLFLDFTRTGNRARYEAVSFERRHQLCALVMAECVEGKGKFLDDIANGVWAICEESFWGIPSSFPNRDGLPDVTRPTLELFAGETCSLLAWTDYLLHTRLDSVSRALRPRIRLENERRILTPGLEHDDYGWMGLRSKSPVNNWNPWICSNWLTAALLLEPDAARRAASVHKILRCLDRFLAGYAPDGGWDEGPSYWFRAGASLFECLDWLRLASAGKLDFFSLPLVAEIGRYICRVHIAGEWFVNFADASAKIPRSGDIIYRFGRAVKDERMMAFGAWSRPAKFSARTSLARALPAALTDAELRRARASAPLLRDAWFPGIQVMTARARDGESRGLYVAAQGGHNAESHNHNDVGNFVVYSNGEPALIDVGVETYTAKTFSPKRYEIWTMQSAYHNCPTVNGVMQSAGRQIHATDVVYRTDDAAAELSLDIAKAYPAEAGIRSWRRSIRLDRAANRIEVTDRYALDKSPSSLTLTLMSALQPALAPGRILIPARASIAFDPAALTPKVEEAPTPDPSLKRVWGERVYRIQLAAVAPGREGEFRLRIDGAPH